MSKFSLSKIVEKFDPYRSEVLQVRDGIAPIEIEESHTKINFTRWFMLTFVIFLIWAGVAPIDSGIHVAGTVVVQGNRKAVQHPQGGVVQEILVSEGSVVKEGDRLVRINPLGLQAELNAVDLDYINAITVESRLIAERANFDKIRWLSDLDKFGDSPKVAEAQILQERILTSRRADLKLKLEILSQEAVGWASQIQELNQVKQTRRDQLQMLSEDLGNMRKLAEEGFVPRSSANDVEMRRSDLIASISGISNDIGRARSDLAAAKLKFSQEQSAYYKEIDGLLSDVQKSRKSFSMNAESVRYNLSLTDIKAPASGIVVGLNIFTVGGVIKAGDTLMEIVPQQGQLIVHAKVPPELIDKVHVGLASDLRFTAFNQYTTPVIPGRVMLVGADKRLKSPIDDASTPAEYYLAHVVTTEAGQKLLGESKIQAGMPVDVIVKTGERTFMSYLLKPIFDRLAISFKDN